LNSSWRSWPPEAKQRLLQRLRAELVPDQFATPGELACYLDRRTIQTPALRLLDQHLCDVAAGRITRLIWTMPPQEGKSQRVSRAFPLWLLLRNPDLRIAIASYEAGIARRWGRAIRNDITARPELGLVVRSDTSAAHEWQLDGRDGGVYSIGIGGALTGRPIDGVLIIDDPLKGRAEADSEVFRKACIEWWQETGSTRLAPGTPVIVVQTRWHEEDLAGWLPMHDEGWTVVNIPACADHDPVTTTDPLGRTPGEYLQSARGRTETDWEQTKRQVGARGWSALYQGRPSPADGGILKRSWWQYYTNPRVQRTEDGAHRVPNADQVIQSWDMAFKDTKASDFVVGQVWVRRGAKAFLVDQVRDRMDFPAACAAVKAMSAKWPQSALKLIEDKANGPAIIAQLRRDVPGLVAYDPKDSKEARAHAVSAFIEAGDVELPADAPWVAEFVEECSAFPNAAHDDQVDAMTQALQKLLLTPSLTSFFNQLAESPQRRAPEPVKPMGFFDQLTGGGKSTP
jgi:predicted phage terminase large subunit-like protein